MAQDLLDLSVDELLDELASARAGSGAVAAIVAAVAAELVAAAARRSQPDWAHAGGAAAQAHALRLRAAPLALSNVAAYEEATALLRAGEDAPEGEERDRRLGRALSRSAEVPLLIAQVAADIAALAKEVADNGAPETRADAVGAALLAHAAARAAAHLVEVNLGTTGDDLRVMSAHSLAAAAGAWADAAVAGER